MSAMDECAYESSAPLSGARDAVTVDTVETLEALQALRPDYERLYQLCGNAAPFALLEWHLEWCRHFMNLDPKVSDRLSVLLVRNSAKVCVAIVPLIISRRRYGPLSIVSADLLGADPSTTETRTPLVAWGYEEATVTAIHLKLAQDPAWHWISWGNLTGTFADAMARHVRSAPIVEAPGYLLDLAPTWDQFRAGLKRNIRESLRHCYNSLRRDGHQYHVDIAMTPADIPQAIDTFLELHAMRALMENGSEHPNHFTGAVSRRFLHAVCRQLAARNVIRVFQLRIHERIVASRIGFVVGDTLCLYYSGFDPEWSRYSVMTTTLAEAIKYAISERLKTVNLSRGTDTSKTRWGPRVIEYRGMVERRDRIVSGIVHRIHLSIRSNRGLPSWLTKRLRKARRVWN